MVSGMCSGIPGMSIKAVMGGGGDETNQGSSTDVSMTGAMAGMLKMQWV